MCAPIVINGAAYPKGLGVHAPAEVVFDVGGAYTHFRADVGIVDTHGNNGIGRIPGIRRRCKSLRQRSHYRTGRTRRAWTSLLEACSSFGWS